MDMSDHLIQWGCPYCSRVFPSRDDFKKHLEPNKQLIVDLLNQLLQAQSPSCQQLRETTEGSTASEGGNDIDLDSTKRSHTEEPLKCPHSDCEGGRAFNRRDYLLRHYKTHVICNVVCECGSAFDVVDQFLKHVKDCQIILAYRGGSTKHDKEYKAILGTKIFLNKTVSQALNEKLTSLKTSQPEKAMKSSSNNDNPSTTVLPLKRKRSVGNGRETSYQEDSMLEDRKGAVHLGSLGGLDSITSYTYIARNTPNELINDPPLAENTVDGNSLAHESNTFGKTQSSLIETAGVDWNDFYTASGAGLDWNSFYTTLDDFSNIQASEVWTDAQGQATNI